MAAAPVTRLVADELQLDEFTQDQPQASLYGVTNVEIESAGTRYRIYLVKDANKDEGTSEESAKLCAFYNSQFILRAIQAGKLRVPAGEFQVAFQIDDQGTNHSVFVVKVPHGKPSHNLNFEQLCLAAENLAELHAVNTAFVSSDLHKAIVDNHSYVAEYERKLHTQLADILKSTLENEPAMAHRLFREPLRVSEKVQLLLTRVNSEEAEPRHSVNDVICHGRMGASALHFHGNQLVEVADWENVHFADPAKDLCFLLVSSASPEIRKNHYLKIIRNYYYKLVDLRAPDWNLTELRDMYRRHQKEAVLAGIENLLDVIMNGEDEVEKEKTAKNWEAALDDSYAFETDDYISDDEHCYFSK